MHVFGVRRDHVVAERPERVADHVHVVVEVTWTGLVGERGEELGCPVGGDERSDLVECSGGDTPPVFAAEDLGGELVQHVGRECAGDPRLDVALRAVVEQRSGRLDPRRGVRDVVGEHLVFVGATLERGQSTDPFPDDPVCEIDGVGGKHHPILVFISRAEVAGVGGCNRFQGAAETKDGKVQIGPLAVTSMSCSPERDELEQRFLAALQKPAKVQRNFEQLYFVGADGEVAIRFHRSFESVDTP